MKLKMKESISFSSLTYLGETIFNHVFILLLFSLLKEAKKFNFVRKFVPVPGIVYLQLNAIFKFSINFAKPKTEYIPVTYDGGLLIFTGFPLAVAVVLKPKFKMI